MTLSKYETSFRKDGDFVASDLKEGESPTTKQRLRSIAALSIIYYLVTHKILRPLLMRVLSAHSQWKVLATRAGTFNKNAQDEVVYIGLAGLHHVLCALMAEYARYMKSKDENSSIGGISHRSLYVYAGLTEFAFEWVDFALMALRHWPYEDRDPKFSALLVFHHLFGLLNFRISGGELSYRDDVQSLSVKLLGVAGVGCLVYPLQQLLDLKTRSGNQKALLLNMFNMACHVYVRFYLYFTQARGIFVEGENMLKRTNQGHLVKTMWAGYYSLTVFNVVVFLGGMQKMAQYISNLRSLKH